MPGCALATPGAHRGVVNPDQRADNMPWGAATRLLHCMTGITFRPPRQPLVPPGGADLHARDMTATFSADMTLAEAQRRLGEIGQWLPVDGHPDAPLGRLVEENSTGPLRLGYGAWRDLLLGVQFTNGRGELITAGGRTVKNVAGYDLTKFMVGQHGVFGRVDTLTVRTYRRPDGALLVLYAPDAQIVSRLLDTPLRPQWALLTGTALRCGYLGDGVTLDWYEANVGSSQPLQVTRRTVEQDAEDRANEWAWRLAHEPRRLATRYLVDGPPAYRSVHRQQGPATRPRSATGRFLPESEHADVAVAIVTYNSARHVGALIESLRADKGKVQ